jgi:hypothetical protein
VFGEALSFFVGSRSLAPVRASGFIVVVAALAFATSEARADDSGDRDVGALAFVTGTSVFLAGFGLGGILLSTDGASHATDNAGWMSIQTGFVLAPLAAHGVSGEWMRGLAFAAPPAAMEAGAATVLLLEPDAVRHGNLTQQRLLWSFLGVGLFSSAVGIVDATFAGSRARALSLAPRVGSGEVGLELGGVL